MPSRMCPRVSDRQTRQEIRRRPTWWWGSAVASSTNPSPDDGEPAPLVERPARRRGRSPTPAGRPAPRPTRSRHRPAPGRSRRPGAERRRPCPAAGRRHTSASSGQASIGPTRHPDERSVVVIDAEVHGAGQVVLRVGHVLRRRVPCPQDPAAQVRGSPREAAARSSRRATPVRSGHRRPRRCDTWRRRPGGPRPRWRTSATPGGRPSTASMNSASGFERTAGEGHRGGIERRRLRGRVREPSVSVHRTGPVQSSPSSAMKRRSQKISIAAQARPGEVVVPHRGEGAGRPARRTAWWRSRGPRCRGGRGSWRRGRLTRVIGPAR